MQIFLRIHREELEHSYLPPEYQGMLVPEMAPASPWLSFPTGGPLLGVLECSNDIVFIGRSKVMETSIFIPTSICYNDRKGWPDIQTLPVRSAVCAENSEIETER